MLARSGNARSVVEFGTAFGISTLHLAAVLRDDGGGKVISTEFAAAKIAKAQASIAGAVECAQQQAEPVGTFRKRRRIDARVMSPSGSAASEVSYTKRSYEVADTVIQKGAFSLLLGRGAEQEGLIWNIVSDLDTRRMQRCICGRGVRRFQPGAA
jgi:hypothetical protein